MRGVTVRAQQALDEVIDGARTVSMHREEWLFEAGEAGPALVVERSVPAVGLPRRPVLLVHGFAQNRFTWRVSGRSFVASLVAQGFEVLNVELRGHGRSREAGSPSAAAFSDYVDDVSRVVAACEQVPLAIGHSLGAAVLAGVATERPLQGLVHLAGVHAFARSNRTLRGLARLTLGAESLLRAVPARMQTRWAGALLAELYQVSDVAGFGFPISGWTPGSMERALLQERLVEGFDWTSTEVWLEMSRWATGEPFPYAADFVGLDLPLLIAAGDADPLVSPADAERCFEASGSSDKRLLIFDNFHHEVHWGHIDLILGRLAPKHVWPELQGWLDGHA